MKIMTHQQRQRQRHKSTVLRRCQWMAAAPTIVTAVIASCLLVVLLEESYCTGFVGVEPQSKRYNLRPTNNVARWTTSTTSIISLCMTTHGPSSDSTNEKNEFWQQQRALLNEMTDRTERSLKREQLEKFRNLQGKLVEETVFVSTLLFALLWSACENPFVAFSYAFGALFGLAYTYGLGKYVETLGGTAEDASAVQGAGVGQARFAFLILLLVLVGKLRAFGLLEIPSIFGFFTYQIASLTQGLRDETY